MLWRDLKVWQVYGANTDVGKTIASTILCRALQRRVPNNGVLYLKPVSTGPQSEADDRHITRFAPGTNSRCLSQFSEPISPHLAAKRDSAAQDQIEDNSIVAKIKRELSHQVKTGTRYALLETAGGVLSPGPSGTVQADLYRPLRLPTLLIGDHKLGGIATTLSAFESLHIRGYSVDAVLMFNDQKWRNYDYLHEHLKKHRVKVVALGDPPPQRDEDPRQDSSLMESYYSKWSEQRQIDPLIDHLNKKHFERLSSLTSMPSKAEDIVWHPFRQHGIAHNIIAIDSAYGDNFEAYNGAADPAVVSATNDNTTGISAAASQQSAPLTTSLFDASASWWTQGFGHGNPDLALAAANAAGRYGHVMFAHSVHEPALDLCYNLLQTLANPRLARVFFTDNGSTAMEVGIKMALRASAVRYGWHRDDDGPPIEILGLKGSYHGDTIGAMNASEPSVFNKNVDWYKPQGVWFDPPQVLMQKGKWRISVPESFLEPGATKTMYFKTLPAIFDFDSRQKDAAFYRAFIAKALQSLVHDQGRRFGALVMEPIIMGAGGMIFVDPLFQHMLITTIRANPSLINPSLGEADQTQQNPSTSSTKNWSGLPVVADEVFTGLYRLGRASSSSFLNTSTSSSSTRDTVTGTLSLTPGTAPDISAHAKLLTGGLLPLALTTASDSIFQAFYSSEKPDALLHGHSYTAHAVGCAVANHSLAHIQRLFGDGSDWQEFRSAWQGTAQAAQQHNNTSTDQSPNTSVPHTTATTTSADQTNPWSVFPPFFITHLSHHPLLSGVWSLGTVLALTMAPQSPGGGGYASNATASLQNRLLTTLDPTTGEGVHARVLGDVIYVMTSLTTRKDAVERVCRTLERVLEEERLARG